MLTNSYEQFKRGEWGDDSPYHHCHRPFDHLDDDDRGRSARGNDDREIIIISIGIILYNYRCIIIISISLYCERVSYKIIVLYIVVF